MYKLSMLADYATTLTCTLAQLGNNISSQKLALTTKIEVQTIKKVMRLLRIAGIVTASSGCQGGYQLHKPLADIPLSNLIEAIEGPLSLTKCPSQACAHQPHCFTQNRWQQIHQEMHGILQRYSLADFLTTEKQT
jgi:Rrf2 family protein